MNRKLLGVLSLCLIFTACAKEPSEETPSLFKIDIQNAQSLVIKKPSVDSSASVRSSRAGETEDSGTISRLEFDGTLQPVNGSDADGNTVSMDDIKFYFIDKLNDTWLLSYLEYKGYYDCLYLFQRNTGEAYICNHEFNYMYGNHTSDDTNTKGYYLIGDYLYIIAYETPKESGVTTLPKEKIYRIGLSDPSSIVFEKLVDDIEYQADWAVSSNGTVLWEIPTASAMPEEVTYGLRYPNGTITKTSTPLLMNYLCLPFPIEEDFIYFYSGSTDINYIDIQPGNHAVLSTYTPVVGYGASLPFWLNGQLLYLSSDNYSFLDITDFKTAPGTVLNSGMDSIERYCVYSNDTIAVYGLKNGITTLGLYRVNDGISYLFQNGEYTIDDMSVYDGKMTIAAHLGATDKPVLLVYDGSSLTEVDIGMESGNIQITAIR